jgi:hypothetical protein
MSLNGCDSKNIGIIYCFLHWPFFLICRHFTIRLGSSRFLYSSWENSKKNCDFKAQIFLKMRPTKADLKPLCLVVEWLPRLCFLGKWINQKKAFVFWALLYKCDLVISFFGIVKIMISLLPKKGIIVFLEHKSPSFEHYHKFYH